MPQWFPNPKAIIKTWSCTNLRNGVTVYKFRFWPTASFSVWSPLCVGSASMGNHCISWREFQNLMLKQKLHSSWHYISLQRNFTEIITSYTVFTTVKLVWVCWTDITEILLTDTCITNVIMLKCENSTTKPTRWKKWWRKRSRWIRHKL